MSHTLTPGCPRAASEGGPEPSPAHVLPMPHAMQAAAPSWLWGRGEVLSQCSAVFSSPKGWKLSQGPMPLHAC